MIPHQPSNHITRTLECTSCHEKSRIRMETYLLEYEWSCPICGSGNIYRNKESRSMVPRRYYDDMRR